MKSSASLVASGKILSAPFAENGRIYRCPFHPSASACSTHTGSPTFVRWKRYAASLAIPRHGSSHSSAAQKNRLQQLRQNALRLVRQEAATGSRPVLRGYAHLSGNLDQKSALPALRKSEARTARLPGGQPVLHQAVCLVRGQALPEQHGFGCRPRTESGLAHRQGTGQAIHDGSTGTRRDTGTQGHRHRRNLDPQRAHLSNRGQRFDTWASDLVRRGRPFGGHHAAPERCFGQGQEDGIRAPSGRGQAFHQGAEIRAAFQPRKPDAGWQALLEGFASGKQTAEHGVPAERIVWPVVGLQHGRLGAAFLRELEGQPEMAAPETLREICRDDRASLGWYRRLLQTGEQGLARFRRRTQQQDTGYPAPGVWAAR